MEREQIIQWAREAGMVVHEGAQDRVLFDGGIVDSLNRFAELVAAHEREACAKKVVEFAQKWWSIHCDSNKHMETTRKAHDDFCALQAAIRARK